MHNKVRHFLSIFFFKIVVTPIISLHANRGFHFRKSAKYPAFFSCQSTW